MNLSYATKARVTSYLLPLLVVLPFALFGYHSMLSIFAQTPAPAGITVYTDQPVYKVGETIAVTLSNATPNNVYVLNNCPDVPLTVYRFENNSWINIHGATDASKCAGEPHDYEIPANHSIMTDYRYWPNLFSQPGRYRITAYIESYSQGSSVEFQIIN